MGFELTAREAYTHWDPETCEVCGRKATIIKRGGPAGIGGDWWKTGEGGWLCPRCLSDRHEDEDRDDG